MNLSIGGRYCSIMTVDGGKLFFADLMIASMATANERIVVINAGSQMSGEDVTSIPSIPEAPRVLRSALSHFL